MREHRGALRGVLAAAVVALGVLAALLAAPSAPPAHAGEGSPFVPGNYVPLAKPTRVLTKTLTANTAADFTAAGVAGIPRDLTFSVVLTITVTGTTNTAYPNIKVRPNGSGGVALDQPVNAMSTYTNATRTITVQVDPELATNQLRIWDASGSAANKSAVSVAVDAVGYYSFGAVGGGFVPVRPTLLLDTRVAPEVVVPAGGSITRTLTGGIVPTGASAVHVNLAATGFTAAGGVVAVPAGTDPATAGPVLRFWSGAVTVSDLVVLKPSADGRVTFKNTSAQAVHLVVRAVGYTTGVPGTGFDWRPGVGKEWATSLPGGQSLDLQLADDYYLPKDGVGAVWLDVQTRLPGASGGLTFSTKGQAASAVALTHFAVNESERRTSVLVVPGEDGTVTVRNTGTAGKVLGVTIRVHGWFAAPTSYAAAGGNPALAMARTSLGPCYGHVDPVQHNVRVGCDAEDGSGPVYAVVSPAGHTFRGPLSLVARPGGRVVVTALHAPDGEVWTWDLAFTPTGPAGTPVRTFRHSRVAPVSATLPGGAPVGFTTDAQGRLWAIDLGVAAPEQPRWRPLDLPAAGLRPVGELTALSTPAGIRLAGVTSTGDVVTGLYAATTSISLGWQSLGATGATARVALGTSVADEVRLAVRHDDGTVWSARLAPTGSTVDGWHPVGTTYAGSPIVPSGSPALVYDPQTQRNGVLVRSDEVGTGVLYRIWETTPGAGDFTGPADGVPLESGGIGSDVTVWDYRTETPLYRRWSLAYLDSSFARKLGTVYAS